jgi:hypothetical protein
MSRRVAAMTSKSTSFKGDGPAKKPYESPRLEVYGDIREVTDAGGNMGMLDNGTNPASMRTA